MSDAKCPACENDPVSGATCRACGRHGPMPTAEQAVRMALSQRLPLTDEKMMQSSLADVFIQHGVPFEREKKLGQGDIVDFMLPGGIAVECKLRGSKRQIYRQLERYAEHEEVTSIVLLSNTAMGLPETINGKPAYYGSLGTSWL